MESAPVSQISRQKKNKIRVKFRRSVVCFLREISQLSCCFSFLPFLFLVCAVFFFAFALRHCCVPVRNTVEDDFLTVDRSPDCSILDREKPAASAFESKPAFSTCGESVRKRRGVMYALLFASVRFHDFGRI